MSYRKKQSLLLLIIFLLLVIIAFSMWFFYVREIPPSVEYEEAVKQMLTAKLEPQSIGGKLDDAVLARMHYEILSRENSRLRLYVTAPDIEALIHSDGRNLLAESDGLDVLLNLLERDSFSVRSWEIDVELDENGVPVDPFPVYDAMYGGLLSQVNKMLEEES